MLALRVFSLEKYATSDISVFADLITHPLLSKTGIIIKCRRVLMFNGTDVREIYSVSPSAVASRATNIVSIK